MNFKQYLRLESYSEASISRYNKRIEHFVTWCKSKNLKPTKIVYKDLIQLVKDYKKRGLADTTINIELNTISRYFEYLIACENRKDNPIKSLKIKTPPRRQLYELLSEMELEDLYHSFEVKGQDEYIRATAFRNKIITGLLVFQGINNAGLEALGLTHLKLSKGKIYIPSTTRTRARNLELKSIQIVDLLHYEKEIIPILHQRVKVNHHKLFPLGDKTKLTSITGVIIKKLKEYNSKVENIKQIRASVITNWLKNKNVRRVQFLAGHKRIMSTEFYKKDHIEKLQNMIDRFHPLY